MNDHELEHNLFPRLVRQLEVDGEVWVDIDLAPHFAHHLMRHQRDTWQVTEQETSMDPDWQVRFYLRTRKGSSVP